MKDTTTKPNARRCHALFTPSSQSSLPSPLLAAPLLAHCCPAAAPRPSRCRILRTSALDQSPIFASCVNGSSRTHQPPSSGSHASTSRPSQETSSYQDDGGRPNPHRFWFHGSSWPLVWASNRQMRRDGQLKIRVRHKAQSRRSESRRGEERRGEEREEGNEGMRRRPRTGSLYTVWAFQPPRDDLVDSRSRDLLRYGGGLPPIAQRRQTILMVLPSTLSPALLGGVSFESVLGSVLTLAVGSGVLQMKLGLLAPRSRQCSCWRQQGMRESALVRWRGGAA